MKKRILILGSGGQIGAYLTDYLNDRGYEVLEFDVVNGLHQDMTEIPNPELHRQIMRSHFVYFLLEYNLSLSTQIRPEKERSCIV